MSDADKNIEFSKHEQEDEQNPSNNHDLIDDEHEEGQVITREDMNEEEDDELREEEDSLNAKNSSLEDNNINNKNSKEMSNNQKNLNNDSESESLIMNENVNNLNEDSKHSSINKDQQDDENNKQISSIQQHSESPEKLFKKLEIIKEIKSKTMNLQRIKSRLAQEVESFEQETKCLHNCQNELELLIQEKLAHLEELRQIQNDISTMESTIKQADEEKRKALEMVRRLHIEYRPLKEQLNHLRESIGLDKTDDNDDVDIIEAFLNKLQPFSENSNKLNTSNELKSDNNNNNKSKHIKGSNNNESSSLSPIPNKNLSSTKTQKEQQNKSTNNNYISTSQQQQHQQQNLLKSQSMDLPLQLATVALMAHSLRSKSPQNSLQQPSGLPFNMFGNQLEENSTNALKQFNQFVLNQSNKDTSNNLNNSTSTNTNNNNNNSGGPQLQPIPPPSFRQQPPPMKSCLSCGQQIHRNAPICPLCKAKSRSRNPKKPKGQKESMNINDLSPCSSSSNINFNHTSSKNINNNTSQKVKQHGDKKNRC